MFNELGNFSLSQIVLAAVASLGWSACLVTTTLRWRAFRQRADIWWMLAYLCMLGVGVGRTWMSFVWWSTGALGQALIQQANHFAIADLLVNVLFAAAALMAVFANRRRPDAFDV
ncbi:MAG: hypothetical protein ABI780_09945 [Ardenticatenales bacterium]